MKKVNDTEKSSNVASNKAAQSSASATPDGSSSTSAKSESTHTPAEPTESTSPKPASSPQGEVPTSALTDSAITSTDDSDRLESARSEPTKLKPKATRKVSSRIKPSNATNQVLSSAHGKSVGTVSQSSTISATDDIGSGTLPGALSMPTADGLSPVINSGEGAKYLPNRAPFQQAYQPVNQNSDRIAIFIDGSNLFYAASHLNIEVDYRRLLTTLVRGRRLLRAYFYTGVDPQNEKQRGFLLWLNRHGHRVVSKELAHLPDGSRKANMHVEMAVDMMRISDYCSTLTLLGGDGNLAYALQVLSQRGTSIEVVSLQSMTSDSLIDLADTYTDLADLRDEIKR